MDVFDLVDFSLFAAAATTTMVGWDVSGGFVPSRNSSSPFPLIYVADLGQFSVSSSYFFYE